MGFPVRLHVRNDMWPQFTLTKLRIALASNVPKILISGIKWNFENTTVR